MIRHHPSLIAPLLVIGLAAATAACDVKVGENGLSFDIARGKATDEWTRTYTVAAGGRLEIVNVNGGIEAFPAIGSQVEVRARREVKTHSDETARQLLERLEMLEEVSPDRIRIEARSRHDERDGALTHRPDITVSYRLNVPPGLNVSLKTENGGVRVDNVQGQIVATSTNGGVIARAVSGAMSATTVNGGIMVDLTSVTADMQLVTVNGGVRLTVPPDAGAMLEASAVNGGVSVDEALTLTATERARLRVVGRINEGGPKIVLQTTNGGVRVAARDGSGT